MTSAPLSRLTVLPEAEWQARQRAHESRVRVWTDPHQARAARGEKHPVWDFLMEYYPFRPAWLRRWHPGPDVALVGSGARSFLRWREYVETSDGVMISVAAFSAERQELVAWLRNLLRTMQARPPFFGCHGMHEWAMVYRQAPLEKRHPQLPLRLGPADLERFVAAGTLHCTHFDAFRFFTPEAQPLNRLRPTRQTVPAHEQRGCLHANMDLYKWAFKLAPFTASELIADCFALAREIREVDMRASPYDLRAIGVTPIPIETPSGRAEYESHQRSFSLRGGPMRERLIALCDRLLA
jgi:hypothetical protein